VHLTWQSQRRLWSEGEQSPEQRVRPFSTRGGTLPGEGGAVFYLEDREAALARGATALAEVTGYGQRFVTPGGDADASVRSDALKAAADGTPDWIAPTGLGRPDMDALEVAAYNDAFGADLGGAAAVLATPWIGFSGPATAPLQLAVGILAARGELVPQHPIEAEAASGCESMMAALGRTGRTGAGAHLVSSCFSIDGVHAAFGVRIEA
jgi:3-oxoacyl-(acyl-carrier-protein) synthase